MNGNPVLWNNVTKWGYQAIFMEIEWHFYGPFSTSAFNINCIVNTGERKKNNTCQNIALFGYLCPWDNFSNLSINGLLNSLSKAQSAISDDISVSIIYWIKAKFEAKQAQFVNHFSVFFPLTTWQLLTFHFFTYSMQLVKILSFLIGLLLWLVAKQLICCFIW